VYLYIYIFSEPSIPGPVTSSENDLDASDGNINIKWTAGTGATTLYRVKLFDDDTQKGSRDASFVSTTFNNVLNGYRYNVYVTARSQQFHGNYLWSEAKVSPIKTKVQGNSSLSYLFILHYIELILGTLKKKERNYFIFGIRKAFYC
jgi:hypothetical protein